MRTFVLFGLLVACTSIGPLQVDAGGGNDPLTLDERAHFDLGAPSAATAVEVTGFVDRMFQFDPTLDPSKTAGENALAIKAEVAKNLGDLGDGGVKCGSVTLTTNSIAIDFGPPPGCNFKGVMVSGAAKLDVSGGMGMLTVGVTFTNVSYGGESINGMATFTTSNGTTFTMNANVTVGKATYNAVGFTITGSPGSIKLDGVIGVGDTAATLMGVIWKQGDCYPSSGSIVLKKGLISQTITMTSATATTGQVTVTVGKKTSTTCLPSYGTCTAMCMLGG